jgi:hypothetical protein
MNFFVGFHHNCQGVYTRNNKGREDCSIRANNLTDQKKQLKQALLKGLLMVFQGVRKTRIASEQ